MDPRPEPVRAGADDAARARSGAAGTAASDDGAAHPGGIATAAGGPPAGDPHAAPDAADSGAAAGPGPRVTGTRSDYLRAAVTPRLLGLFVLLLAAAVVCVRLGAWQLDRAAIRGAERAETAHAQRLAADPVPLEEVHRAQTSFTAEELGRAVEVTGEYDPAQQVLVPGRSVDGQAATLVVTALRVTQGPDAGAMLPVLRGWVPADAVRVQDGAATPADAATAALLEVPAGERRVTGHLGGSEAAVTEDHPDGMVGAISTAELTNLWGGPTFGGYLVEFTETGEGRAATAPTGLPHAPPPSMAQETGLNIQNLAYAVEWVIFGGFALFIWWRMVRDEVTYRREEAGLA
ncbi:SURF1 family protein [Georgenia sp. AZ-5]|uniref:SURF1 family protein n=1 Tax=Georgenia sp. AZ-5 TaxID=3367526 RepID=UPI003754BE3F